MPPDDYYPLGNDKETPMADEQIIKDLDNAQDLKVDELLRTIVGQMFEADNDRTTLYATLEAADGTTSELEFVIHVTKINGVATRAELNQTQEVPPPNTQGNA